MKLEHAARLHCYGTSDGVKKAWDERGRKDPSEELAEKYSKEGKGLRKIVDGIQVYFPTFAESATMGMHIAAVIAGRNLLTYHDTNSGTKWHYRGQTVRGVSTDDAVTWAVSHHIAQQQKRQINKQGSKTGIVWSQGSLRSIVARAAQSVRLTLKKMR